MAEYITLIDQYGRKRTLPATTALSSIISPAVAEYLDANPVGVPADIDPASIAWDTYFASVSASEKSTWNGKQDALVSGTNIKTVNNNSLLGSGNIDISSGLTLSQTLAKNFVGC